MKSWTKTGHIKLSKAIYCRNLQVPPLANHQSHARTIPNLDVECCCVVRLIYFLFLATHGKKFRRIIVCAYMTIVIVQPPPATLKKHTAFICLCRYNATRYPERFPCPTSTTALNAQSIDRSSCSVGIHPLLYTVSRLLLTLPNPLLNSS